MKNSIYGAVVMGCFMSALFFLNFWKRSRDRFFGLFALAFLLLGLSWWVHVVAGIANEFNRSVHLLRLIAFLLIILAVIDKNRSPKASSVDKPRGL
jgi:uncharacterized membrane protein